MKRITQVLCVFAVCVLISSAASASTINVLWDTSHGVALSFEPSGAYSDLVQQLVGEGYSVDTTSNGVLVDDPGAYDIMVVCLGSSVITDYTAAEVTRISDFVNAGGGLLIMGDNPGTPNSRIAPVASAFGVTLGISEAGSPSASNLADHPIFDGVSAIYMLQAGEVSAVAPSVEVAWEDSTTVGLVTAAVYGSGHVVAMGDVNLFTNSTLGQEDNVLFASNTFGYLSTPVGPQSVRSMSADDLEVTFVASGGDHGLGQLTATGQADVVVEDLNQQQFTFAGGTFEMTASLQADDSVGGLVSGRFSGGTLHFRDADGEDLLAGDLLRLTLFEVGDDRGMLAGDGLFEVTGGSLQEHFTDGYGKIFQMFFEIDPSNLDSFAASFAGFSDITVVPTPEPASLILIAAGAPLMLRRRRK